jgi:hypothetical protein
MIKQKTDFDVPPGRQSEEEIALARMLDKIFKRSDSIDREALCILTGERVFFFFFLKKHNSGMAHPYSRTRSLRFRWWTLRLRHISLRSRTPSFPSTGR